MSEEATRRDLLRHAALTLTATGLAGGMSPAAAQHVHHAAAAEKKATGAYKPKSFNAHEFATLRRLAELIVPADARSPSALEAGAPEFIDLLSSRNSELAAIFTGGLAWLDAESQRRHGAPFLDAAAEKQIALLDLLAYRKNDSPKLGPGIRFFEWARRLTVDAYYTSKVGVADLGYMGNTALAEFQVPR